MIRPFYTKAVIPLLFSLASFAQDDLFITVSAPDSGSIFSTVSSVPKAPPEEKKTEPAPGATDVDPGSSAQTSKNEEKWERELLRDPFWPVGFFPEGWRKKTSSEETTEDDIGWKTAVAKLRISGTSQLGSRTVAIINGELKGVGDQVEVDINGRFYRWQVVEIDTSGQVRLKKIGIR